VCFFNSEHVSGRLGKASLGSGNNTGLFSMLINEYGATISAVCICINRIAKLASRFMGRKGFSIGIDDLLAPVSLVRRKREIMMSCYDECKSFIRQSKSVASNLDSKLNRILKFESNVTKILNEVREKVGIVCMSALRGQNTTLIMSSCGSKGSPLNISQMVFCVGQQTVNGRRIYNGFQSRTLPHFHPGETSACEKGFVIHSFCDGLNPLECWFHTMGGREGLVDTAVKTAETGYMSRRLMKALENFFLFL
jgi:DNA-directed RNA polymerase III subunit RPC1